MSYHIQVKMFKHLIPIGERSSEEIIDYLKNKFDTIEINFSELPSYKKEMHRTNAKYCVKNSKLNVEIKDMSFRVFKIIENEKSIDYIDPRESEWGNFLFFVFEEKTKYMSCNSNNNRLLREMFYFAGISQESYDKEDFEFKDVLSKLMFDYLDDKFLYKKITQKLNK